MYERSQVKLEWDDNKLPLKDTISFSDFWTIVDEDQDGYIAPMDLCLNYFYKDFKAACYPPKDSDIEPAFISGWYNGDHNMDEVMDLDEWHAAVNPQTLMVTSHMALDYFEDADADKDGLVTFKEANDWFMRDIVDPYYAKIEPFKEMEALFDWNGGVKFDQFKQFEGELKRLEILKPTENIKELFGRLDIDQDNSLETEEACIEILDQVRGCVEFDDLKDATDYDYKWDLDRNNYLIQEEYFMGKANNPFEKRHIEEEFKFFDADSDGDVTFAEIETIKLLMVEIEEVKQVFGIIDPTDDYATQASDSKDGKVT